MKSARLGNAPAPTDTSRSVAAAVAKPRILCAIDSSEHSLVVLSRAVVMANQLDATLTLLHVVSTEQESPASVSERIQRQVNSAHPPARHQPAMHIRTGDYLPTIATSAEEAAADLVVLDSRPWKPLLSPIAATAGMLAGLVRRPVLIVKRGSRAPYGSVLIAVEQSATFNQVLRALSSWRLLESETVTILHGFESPYRGPLYAAGFELNSWRRNTDEWEHAARRTLLQGLDAAGVTSDHLCIVFTQSRPVREIQREVRRVAPDLLVIATSHHSAVDRVMRASVGNDLLRNIECDVLAVPMKPS